jgi:polyhydroxyalkanoate synthesis regulator phasin
MTPKLAKLLVGGLTATVLAAAVGGAALAQVTPQTPTPAAKTAKAPARQDAFLGALATKLGKSPEEVRAAVVAAQKDLIDQAVAAGRLTQAQGDRMKQRIDQNGGRGALRTPQLPARAQRPALPAIRATMADLATFLGFPNAQALGQELRAGKSLATIAGEHGKSRDQLKQYLGDQAKARADEAVKNGRLTQEQATRLLQGFTQSLDRVIDRAAKPRQGGQPKPGAPAKPSGGTSL